MSPFAFSFQMSYKLMGSSSSRHIRPEISLCSPNGSSDGSPEIPSSSRLLLGKEFFTQCAASSCESKLQPMPGDADLNQRFKNVLDSIDLPADKERILKGYSNEQKWKIICTFEAQAPMDEPSFYVAVLWKYLQSRSLLNSSSSSVLGHLEVSLRTNTIEWVKEFLGEPNLGFELLVEYLKMNVEILIEEHREADARREGQAIAKRSQELRKCISGPPSLAMRSNHSKVSTYSSPTREQRLSHLHRLRCATATNDVHLCLLCLRAITNSRIGFNSVIEHDEAIDLIVLSLVHKGVRTKALVLNLLAAICMVKGSHEIVLAAFDNFKEVFREKRRFETMLQHFIKHENFHMDFMLSCIKFLNVLVHAVEDLNHRVRLQHEMTALDLDAFLEKLSQTESGALKAEVDAYRSSFVDVKAHMKAAEIIAAANERIKELENKLVREVENNENLKHEAERWRHEAESAKRAAPKPEVPLKPRYVRVLPTPSGTNEDGPPQNDSVQLTPTPARLEKPIPPPRKKPSTHNQ